MTAAASVPRHRGEAAQLIGGVLCVAACDAEFHEAGIGEGDRAEDLGGQTRDVHRPRIGARG